VTTVAPSRTFWDKVVILHGLRRWWDRRGELKGGGQRISRHYYDVYRLLASEIGQNATGDMAISDKIYHRSMQLIESALAEVLFTKSRRDSARRSGPNPLNLSEKEAIQEVPSRFGERRGLLKRPNREGFVINSRHAA
jgi:hypothetical protein